MARGAAAAGWLLWVAGSVTGLGAEGPAKPKPAAKGESAGSKKSAATDSKSKPKPAAADPAKATQEATQGLGAFGKMLPMGQKNRDVKIPSFRDGIPSSFIRAATMTRIDGEKMDMERLDIRMFGETEDKDLRIMLPTATYHMATEVLSSEDRSRVSRKDFDLQGDTLTFDTRSQQGKMTGHIHMIIHDADSFQQKPEKTGQVGSAEAVQPKDTEKAQTPSEKK